jgi:hypothetical protein
MNLKVKGKRIGDCKLGWRGQQGSLKGEENAANRPEAGARHEEES